jgi:hypothetical protein
VHPTFLSEFLNGRNKVGYLGVHERIILIRILKKIRYEGVGWIHEVQDMNHWWALNEHSASMYEGEFRTS